MFDRAFLDVMTQRAQLLPRSTVGQYGKTTFGSPVSMSCYWVQGNESAEGMEGGSSQRNGTLYIAPPAYWDTPYGSVPSTDDGVNLPDGTYVTPLKVVAYRDADEVVGLEMVY
jgi:hypothetical protein